MTTQAQIDTGTAILRRCLETYTAAGSEPAATFAARDLELLALMRQRAPAAGSPAGADPAAAEGQALLAGASAGEILQTTRRLLSEHLPRVQPLDAALAREASDFLLATPPTSLG